MISDAVLTDDEKVIRFRKVLSKRKFFTSLSGDDDPNNPQDLDNGETMDAGTQEMQGSAQDLEQRGTSLRKSKIRKHNNVQMEPVEEILPNLEDFPVQDDQERRCYFQKVTAIETEIETIYRTYKVILFYKNELQIFQFNDY